MPCEEKSEKGGRSTRICALQFEPKTCTIYLKNLVFNAKGGCLMVVHPFSDREAIRIAAEIERKGERFYRMALGVAKDGAACTLLQMLRDQEKAHAARFDAMLLKLPKEDAQQDKAYDLESSAFLSAIAAEVVFPGGVLASLMSHKLDTLRDILLYAISSEKDSLLFYLEMLTETQSETLKPVLREIIAEEKKHLYDLQALLEKLG